MMTTSPLATPTPRRRVLVSLPPTGSPHDVIEAGRTVSRALAAALHGVLVWPTTISPGEVPRLLRVDPSVLEGMVIDVDVGDPADRLQAMASAQPIAFLVLTADEHGRDACGIGDIAARTLAAVSAGAIILRPGATLGRLQRILVPLDGTPSTAAALEPAGELAKRAGAALDIVLIEDAAKPPPTEPGAMAPPQYVDQPQHEWPAFSAEFLQRFLGGIAHCPPGVPTRFFLGAGHPSDEILRFAHQLDTDLITLVWHGGCSAEHGGCFRDVIRGTRRPVLVLRR
ncbi:MAG: universal stress protein [Minicystis sp.]